jgi:hemerythrin-like metal-binding protein
LNINNENDYNLGIAWQDIQHRRIIEIMKMLSNNLHVDCMSILAELTFYTRDHFDTEEQYMHELAYDKTESHIEEHKTFVKKVVEVSERCLVGDGLHPNLSSFLEGWTSTTY